jgi:elongation factor G
LGQEGNYIDFDPERFSGASATVAQAQSGEGRFIRHRSATSQYGHVRVIVSPHPGIHCYRFVWEPSDSSLPLPFMKATCYQGVKQALREPLKDGRQLVFVQVSVVDGSYHERDTDEQSVTIAAFMAVRDALERATLIDAST